MARAVINNGVKSCDPGGATLAQSFMELSLIDEFRLFVTPIILGSGKPLFRPMNDRVDLKRVNARTFESGTVLVSYVPQLGRGQT